MPEQVFDVVMEVSVRVVVTDDRVIDRPVNNVDGWRDDLYDLRTRDQVLNHLAFNCIRNGRENALLMDGWADLPENAVTMTIRDVDPDEVFPVTGVKT